MEQKIRAALYARVSTEEQVDGYSLDAQVRAFRAFTKGRSWTVHQEYIEEGKSAHVDDVGKRPVFREAIDDALNGEYNVLVVHKVDRFSRKLRVTLEYIEKLGRADVGFVSILNQVDYSRLEGKLMLVMMGGLAEFYSDNLSEETKKGLAERRAQGFHLGPLPFGVTKGSKGVPVPDPETYQGLVMAFKEASKGKSDRQVAQIMNAHGFRTVGSRGGGPFTLASAKGILTNRFYTGEISDGKGGWMRGKHEPMIDESLFQQVQLARAKNRSNPLTIRRSARTYSLSGLMKCVLCEGPMWIHKDNKGRPRIFCGARKQGLKCQNRGTYLSVYENQFLKYMKTFVIPEDYQERILALYASLSENRREAQSMKLSLLERMERLKKLYQWGDIPESEYLTESKDIKQELKNIVEPEEDETVLERLGGFLSDMGLAWERATDEQRNRLARQLFETIWVRDREVVSVRPKPELRAFFQISEQCQQKSLSYELEEG